MPKFLYSIGGKDYYDDEKGRSYSDEVVSVSYVATTLDDYYHKASCGAEEELKLGKNKEELRERYFPKRDLQRECYEKYAAPIFERTCECCGWHCVEDSSCNYLWCGGEKGTNDGKCSYKRTCEEFWESKERMRTWGSPDRPLSFYTEINKEEFYSNPLNKPKNKLPCPHALKFYSHEAKRKAVEVISNQITYKWDLVKTWHSCDFCFDFGRAKKAIYELSDAVNPIIKNYVCSDCEKKVKNGEMENCLECGRLYKFKCFCIQKKEEWEKKNIKFSYEESQMTKKVRDIIFAMKDLDPKKYQDLVDKLDKNEKGEQVNIYNFPNLQDLPQQVRSLSRSINSKNNTVRYLESKVERLEKKNERLESWLAKLEAEKEIEDKMKQLVLQQEQPPKK